MADFLDTSKPAFYEPPALAKPAGATSGLLAGYQNGQPNPPAPSKTKPKGGTRPR
jgi:hypothetical protein